MIVKNSKKEKNTVTFDVELDSAEFEKYVNGAYLKARSRIMVPGFRKGKAPRMVIEGMYGKDVFYDDAFDNAANDAFAFGVAEGKLETVGRPTMTDSKVTEENGAVLSFSTDVYPEVTLGQYKGLEAEKPSAEVTDEEVDGHIERLRKQNARLVTVERPAQNGDTVNINYAGLLDGIPFDGGTAENQNLVLGSNTFVPGFESQLVGISAGEERDLDITFPENYGHDLGGKAVVFHVKCNEVKFEELPELDDEFAKDNDFDTLAEQAGEGFETLAKTYDCFDGSTVRVKKLLSSPLMGKIGMTGGFICLTGESCVSTTTHAASMPFTMCHEIGHRMAFAREDEANFAGFLACAASERPEFRYSGYYAAFRYCYNALYNADPQAASEVWAGVSAGVAADWSASVKHYEAIRNETAAEVTDNVYDTYLKSFSVESGVQSYGEVTDLLLDWYFGGNA